MPTKRDEPAETQTPHASNARAGRLITHAPLALAASAVGPSVGLAPIELTLERAVEFIADDEIVEITPKSIRLRKKALKEHERKREARETKAA